MKDIIDDLYSALTGKTQAVHEFDRNILTLELSGNGFASAVDNDRFDSDSFEQDDIAHRAADDLGILHRAASELDHHDGVAEFLDKGKCFDQNSGFVNNILHIHNI